MSFGQSVEFNKALTLLSCAFCYFYCILEYTLPIITGWADVRALHISLIAASLYLFEDHL